MFDNLFKDEAKANSNKDKSGGMKQMNINSANTNIRTVDTGGSVLLDCGEELEESDIEAQTKEINGEEVIELGSSGEPLGDSLPEYTNLDPYGETAQKWLTEEEREALQSEVDRFSEEDKEAVKRVQMALNSEEYPSDIDSLWTHLCREEEKFGLEEEKELTEAEKERKLVESMEKQGMNPDFQKKENKSVKDLSGEEFKELIAEAQNDSTEELSQEEPQEEADEPEIEIEELEPSVKEAASEAFRNRNKQYWSEIAEELEIDIPNTKVEPAEEKGKKRVVTSQPKMIEELKRVHKSEEYDTKLHKEGDNTYVGVIPTGVEY